MDEKSWLQVLKSCSDNLKSKVQNPKLAGFLAVFLVGCVAMADAQQPKKVARICYLGNTVSATAELHKAISVNVYVRSAMSRGRTSQSITGIVRARLSVSQTLPPSSSVSTVMSSLPQGTEAAEAAKNATKTIPVVMAFGADAVRRGIVADLARPGGNITGLTNIGAELYGKRLELLKETVPKLARVAFLWSPTNPDADDELKEMETVARFLRVGIQSLEVKGPDDFEGAFRAATKKRAQALMLAGGGFFGAHQKRIVDLAAKNRLPAMYTVVRFVEAGGLMSYGEDRSEMFRRAAEIVDKILKGTKPADIPVERPKKFDFVINLKAAKQIGFTVPPEVLARATRIIK